ncbi:MAG: TonB family protein [Bacteroidales bacterium]|nr:TonB family protein [Bacteroidales bacterium]
MNRFYLLLTVILIFPSFIFAQKTTKITEKSPSKSVKRTYYALAKYPNIKHGHYVEYYNKNKSMEGEYVENKRNGEWFFYTNKQVQIEGQYANGEKIGVWTYYHLNTNKVATEIYINNNRVDSAFGFYENSQLRYEFKTFDDSCGFVNRFYENGNPIEEIILKNDKIEGVSKLFFPNGQLHRETLYQDSKKHTIINCLDTNGNDIYGGTLTNGNGEFVVYYLPIELTSDSLKTRSVETFESGNLNGKASYMQKNGHQESTGYYTDNRESGVWEFYQEDGSFSSKFNYSEQKFQKQKHNTGADFPYYLDYSPEETQMPYFPGGEMKMYQFIGKNIVYPIPAKEMGISGRVFVSFVVTPTGEIEEIKIHRGIGGGCDEEVIKVIQMMPRWIPGLQNGIPVKVQYRMPIKFTLQ